MADPSIDRITAAVTRVENAGDALITSYKLIAADLRTVAGDRAAVLAKADALDAQAAEMEAAVFENTPTPDPASTLT